MDREAVERQWFTRLAAALVVASLAFGAFPFVQSALFPVQKVR